MRQLEVLAEKSEELLTLRLRWWVTLYIENWEGLSLKWPCMLKTNQIFALQPTHTNCDKHVEAKGGQEEEGEVRI